MKKNNTNKIPAKKTDASRDVRLTRSLSKINTKYGKTLKYLAKN